jgi:hypothetical protein
MKNMKETLILTDIDGCVLNWEKAFVLWMSLTKGLNPIRSSVYGIDELYGISKNDAVEYVEEFNSSEYFKKIPPFYDSVKYMKKLNEEFGYSFIGITAIGKSNKKYKVRKENLKSFYGDIFYDLYTTTHHSDKSEVLLNFEGSNCYWIEDVYKNALVGLKYNLNPILIKQSYNNFEHTDEKIKTVNSWKEIYKIICFNK